MKLLIIDIALLSLLLFATLSTPTLEWMGLRAGDGFLHHITYMFAHGSWPHLLVNVYSLLVLAFLCNMEPWQMLVSLAVAFGLPEYTLSPAVPVVGLSTWIYCLTGIVILNSRKWLPLLAINLLVLLASSLLFADRLAVWPHLWCFAMGTIIGLVTAKKFAIYGKGI